jgi:hypothetical protein
MAGGAIAQAQSQLRTRSSNGRALGLVLARAHGSRAATAARGLGNLRYHGGPVEHTNKTYAIYWVPSGYTIQSGYDSLINQYFADVAADSGKTSNVYYTGTQYSDGSGYVRYSSSFGGSYTDTSPLPASGCTDSATPVCLTDAQEQAEIKKDIAAAGWTAGPNTEFFLFTAKGVGSCLTSSECAFTYYCAYHSWIGSGSSVILYANMPYADTNAADCDAGQHPNGNDADATLNVTSHEHNETITDEQGNAWYDLEGYENGDKCAWIFGPLSGPSGAQYNQTINGHHYFLQEEYSNHDHGCVQTGL